jgi:hypothetical protein
MIERSLRGKSFKAESVKKLFISNRDGFSVVAVSIATAERPSRVKYFKIEHG